MAISKEQLASIISGRAKHLCNPEGDRLVEGYTKNSRGGSYDPDPSSYDNDADAFDRMYLSSYDDSSRITNNNEYTSMSATNSRMPDDIKRSMLEHRIDTSALSSTSVLDSLGIKPQRAEKRRQQISENILPAHQSQNNAVDYSIIKAIVNECLNEYFNKHSLNESASLQTIGLNNGTISLVDNKGNVFKAKLEKIGNTNDKK